MTPLSVSDLNEQIKSLLEMTFVTVVVEGEISRITYHNSGHIYFTLKDKNSAISAVMFRGNASKLKFQLEEGLGVILRGAVTLYKPRGSYQINVSSVEPAGYGALALAYEQLKKKLSLEGLFDKRVKKTLPPYPLNVAVITSATSAALQDIKKVASHRWPLAQIEVYDTLVQGDGAVSMIVEAILKADRGSYDAIILTRGGGSIEDLYCFNSEEIARAIYAASTPIISAVGHEIDWVIADEVADLRAATPSAAAQLLLPDQNEVMMSLDAQREHLDSILQHKLSSFQTLITHLRARLDQNSISNKIKQNQISIEDLSRSLDLAMGQKISQKSQMIAVLQDSLKLHHPSTKSSKGYAQIVKDSSLIDLKELMVGEHVKLMQLEASATVKIVDLKINL